VDSRPQEGDYHLNEHEFLNADKSNLALQTQYFTDSLKNFNDIAVHSKMMLELIAKRILGQPKVIPTVYLTDGDFSPPVDEVVAIRAMVMSTQTTPVVITVNGIIPMLVSTVPTQIVTGPISSVTVGNTVPGNPVYVQYLDERAALLSNTSTQDDVAVNGTVSLTGSLPGRQLVILSFGPFAYTNWNNAGSPQSYNIMLSGLSRNRQAMTIIISNTMGETLTGDVWASDTEYQSSGVILGETNSVGSLTSNSGNQNPNFFPSQSTFNIGVDQLQWNTGAPSTAPTSGQLGITIIQEL
jgi:hypothetical protein